MKTLLTQTQKLFPVVATLACVVLAGVMWLPLNQSVTTRNTVVPGTDTQTPEDESLALLADGAQSLLERPLFHITRRPPVAAQAVEAAPVQVTLSLTGVLNNDDVDIALMRLSNSPELLRRRVGDQVGDWQIVEITQTSVTVVTPDGTEQIIGLSSN